MQRRIPSSVHAALWSSGQCCLFELHQPLPLGLDLRKCCRRRDHDACFLLHQVPILLTHPANSRVKTQSSLLPCSYPLLLPALLSDSQVALFLLVPRPVSYSSSAHIPLLLHTQSFFYSPAQHHIASQPSFILKPRNKPRRQTRRHSISRSHISQEPRHSRSSIRPTYSLSRHNPHPMLLLPKAKQIFKPSFFTRHLAPRAPLAVFSLPGGFGEIFRVPCDNNQYAYEGTSGCGSDCIWGQRFDLQPHAVVSAYTARATGLQSLMEMCVAVVVGLVGRMWARDW